MNAKDPVPAALSPDPAARAAAAPAGAGGRAETSTAGPRASGRAEAAKPLLMVDVDGVISLFASGWESPPPGSFHSIEGIPHFLSADAAAHLLALANDFELVWASGWEERADDHLPHLLGLPAGLPFLRFERAGRRLREGSPPANAHWKLDAIDAFAGARPLAWIDDSLEDECHAWARSRRAPTLLVQTDPSRGLTATEAELLTSWARSLRRG